MQNMTLELRFALVKTMLQVKITKYETQQRSLLSFICSQGSKVGWLFWIKRRLETYLVYIGPSPREREKEKINDK